jgi:glutamate dehydrogenase
MQNGLGREAVIGAVEDHLLTRGKPELAALGRIMLARASNEDLAIYGPEALAGFVESAFAHLASRAPGADIRLVDTEAVIDGAKRELTLLEVLNDDMPFLLDSTLAALGEQGFAVRFVVHPILAIERDGEGQLKRFAGDAQAGTQSGTRRESLIQIHLDRIDAGATREALIAELRQVYGDARVAVADWGRMRGRIAEIGVAYATNPPPLPRAEIEEASTFLRWLEEGNFTLLGLNEYRIPESDAVPEAVPGSGLGILADPEVKVLKRGGELVTVTPEIRAFLSEPVPLIVTKASVRSRVHRRVHLDYIGVKRFDPDGRLIGEIVIVGLFTATAYNEPAASVPFIRRKVARALELTQLDHSSHSGRALLNVLESYPRDELFQIDLDTLLTFAFDILAVYERPRVRALARADRFDRFVSILVFIPKDRYDSSVRERVGRLLAQLFDGRLSAAYPAYPEGPLARTHYIVGRDSGTVPVIDPATLDRAIAATVKTWPDALSDALGEAMAGPRARAWKARYANAFSAAYREAFSSERAIADIALIEAMGPERPRAVRFDRREGDLNRVSLEVFARGQSLPLSDRVPLLESMGFRVVVERTYRIVPEGSSEPDRIWLHDMVLERAGGGPIDLDALGPMLEAALMALLAGRAATDGYNALTLEAGLGWRDVQLVRTLSRYLLQLRIPFSQDYMASTLVRHAGLTATIVSLFYARFDPRPEAQQDREAQEAAIRATIETALDAIQSLDEDRILRHFVNLIEAAIRTSYFQLDANGLPRETIAIKFLSAAVEGMPLPKPLVEIFVYDPRVEGVHLRFGKVARGGLRWSDRREDFRTEVLGLVKAQQVKNAVIVPVGAKGGFVPKRLPPPSDRQAFMAEGIAAYQVFVGALLDLTDNLVGGAVVHPANTVRHDADDPYLVVAADKGTATFSDIANALSVERGFWLGDAFASGGSEGYDHKKMGITARGAWEAVKRHFAEMDRDIQTSPFTVAGVGDMSGDVFGNGMLLSPEIRLVAAFDHRDIFIDPAPDAAASLAERQRLFDLPRSSWADYNPALISQGGGIFSRSLKSIPLSPEMRALLDLDREEATPVEVMGAILRARVDLLWFGGIGTYIRAASETDAQVGDKANDAIRITGRQVRAKVIGEGANLGCTQRGRIEAAQAGVRLNTDAIDNSAGVNTSDVEVNIKIALAPAQADGRLDPPARSALLASMTDDVAALVLENNIRQTLALSLAERRGAGIMGDFSRAMHDLEARGRLDRAVEFLPDDAQMAERERLGGSLVRPEISVLLAYAKLWLKDELVASFVPDEALFDEELRHYFPHALVEAFPGEIAAHRLHREIIATRLANAVVNAIGSAGLARVMARTGSDLPSITLAYAATRDIFGIEALHAGIKSLDHRVPGDTQLALYARLEDFVSGMLIWLTRQVMWRPGVLADIVAQGQAAVAALRPVLGDSGAAKLRALGVPPDLATELAMLDRLADVPEIALVAQRTGRDLTTTALAYRALGDGLGIAALTVAGAGLAPTDPFERLAVARALDMASLAHRAITIEALSSPAEQHDPASGWMAEHRAEAERATASVAQSLSGGVSLARLTVAAGLLSDLARG